MTVKQDINFYRNKNVFVTGHTGFKGSWLSYILARAGANVTGYSLEAPTDPSLFSIANINDDINSIIGDVRDKDELEQAIRQARPEIVLHLAAQPLVIDGYINPHYTYETNVMGTVNLLEACRKQDTIKSILNVTTDKVYLNKELDNYGYKEDDPLDGYDPYSNSKSCSEIITHSYTKSFFAECGVSVSTCRAGNVIGGGDFSENRIIPDCIRAVQSKAPLIIRNRFSTRPYQHVLEPLFGYLMVSRKQAENPKLASSYNIGPDDCDCVTTGQLVDIFAKHWGSEFKWEDATPNANAPHEANFLKLDSTKLKGAFNWQPKWHIDDAVEATVDWTRAYINGEDVTQIMNAQIDSYVNA